MKILATITNSIARWYEGKYIPPEPQPENSFISIMSVGHNERHWTAKLAAVLVAFYLKHWQWICTTLIAAISAWAAVTQACK